MRFTSLPTAIDEAFALAETHPEPVLILEERTFYRVQLSFHPGPPVHRSTKRGAESSLRSYLRETGRAFLRKNGHWEVYG